MSFRTRVLGLAFALLAAALPALADVKLAFVDQRRAILGSNAGKEAEKTMSQLQDKKKKELEPASNNCKKLQEELESQRFVLSEEVLQERGIEFERCRSELERQLQAAREEVAIQERKLLAPIKKKFDAAVVELGKAKQFDLILDRSTPGILFSQDALDVTDLVVKQLNGQ